MAFVHVSNCRFNSKRIQGNHTAYTKQIFLLYPHFKVAAVKFGSDFAVSVGVFGYIGVHKVKVYAANLNLPQAELYNAVGHFQFYDYVGPVRFFKLFYRRCVVIVRHVFFVLPAVCCKVLVEIALRVKKAYRGKRKPKVRRGF
ncbi:MAG: hypothetical protein BWY84_00158 [Candidatus Aerophobetes bacterium ADurb.Bin490]|nr:MAG: hypothetical protein BWY84_00158 [Candidatus Aerophobetes bacterium ADurb.Bin490]